MLRLKDDPTTRKPRETPKILGPYHVLEELGKSALGVCRLARLEGPNGFQRWAALRIVLPAIAERHSNTLYARARAAASVLHPNVATLFEIDETDDGTIWMASEFVQGASLTEIAERSALARTPVPWEIATRLILDVSEGLHAIADRASREKIPPMHGAISPWRVIATFDGKAKIISAFEPRLDKEPERLAYTAPEDIFGESIDARSDVFTLGVILWELCTGRRLFQASTAEETCAMIEAHRVPRIGSIVRGFPSSIDELVKKALASRPDARFSSPRELGRAISSAYVAERKVVADEDVAKYLRSLCGDIAADLEERLREAADVTEVFRRHRRSMSSIPTPEMSAAIDPSAFDDEVATEEMRTQKLLDRSVDEKTEEIPVGRSVLDSRADTPSLGADTVRDLAEASAPTPKAGSPSSRPPPPVLEPPPRSERRRTSVPPPPPPRSVRPPPPDPPAPPRPRQPLSSAPPSRDRRADARDSFDDTGAGSEVFFARSRDGAQLVRKQPTPPPSVVIDHEDTKTVKRQSPSIPPGAFADTPIAGVPSVQPPSYPPPALPSPGPPAQETAGRGFIFAVLGATIGVAFFLLIVALVPAKQQEPLPMVLPPLTATTTTTTAIATTPATATTTAPTVTHAPIPTLPVSALPHTNRPRGVPTQKVTPPPPTPAAKNGYLTVMCQPACDDVLLDGTRSLGETPLLKAPVPAGAHRLVLRIASPPLERTVDVNIAEGETTLIKPPMK